MTPRCYVIISRLSKMQLQLLTDLEISLLIEAINPSKTKDLSLGRRGAIKILNLLTSNSQKNQKGLLDWDLYDEEGNYMYKKSFTTTIQKLNNKLHLWRPTNDLTLLGRSLIFKCLGISKFQSILKSPRARSSRQITTGMFNFIWNKKN